MRIKQGYERRTMGGQSMVVKKDPGLEKTEILFALNETGAYLWDGLCEGKTVQELVALLMREYDAGSMEEELIRGDILEFLEQLRRMGALEE